MIDISRRYFIMKIPVIFQGSLFMKMLKPLSLSIALAIISCGAMAQNYSKTVFFGDSLSDTGRIQEIIRKANPALGGLVQKSFTTNPSPVWTQVFAQSYGKTAEAFTADNPKGTNYTIGAAQSGKTADWQGIPILSTGQQIEEYLGVHHDKADPNALYAVWIGANDLFRISEELKNANGNLLLAQNLLQESVGATVKDVQKLHEKGAKVILVPNIPDVSLTPFLQEKSKTDANILTQAVFATQMYNSGIYQGLNQSQANVVPANTFKLLQEAVANPQGFGLTNVTGTACKNIAGIQSTSSSLACYGENSLNEPNANETYLFADAIHPAGRTHLLLAQYYRSILDAPQEIGQISQVLMTQGHTQNQQIHQRLQRIQPQQNNWWIDGHINQTETNQAKTDGLNRQMRVGADIAKGQHNLGLYAQVGQQQFDIAKNSLEYQTLGFGAYHHYQHNQWQLQSHIGMEHLDMEHTRKIAWEGEHRQHQAETDGQRMQAGVRGAYHIVQNNITYAPYVGFNYQHLKINDMAEEQSTLSTSMKFDAHSQKSLQGELGLNVNYRLNPQTKIHGGVGLRHEFDDKHVDITASLLSVPQYSKGFTLPVTQQQDKTIASAYVGADWYIKPNLSLTGGIQAEKASEQQNVGGFIGLNGKF